MMDSQKKKPIKKTRSAMIEAAYIRVQKNLVGRRPTTTDLKEHGITRDHIRHHFSNMTNLHKHMEEKNDLGPFSSMKSILETAGQRKLSEGSKKYLITTAVGDSKAHTGFLDAIDAWKKKTPNSDVIIMPCESKTNSFDQDKAIFDKEFIRRGYVFLNGEMNLTPQLRLLSIQVSANQINPTTGLSRLGSRKRSHVIASPKQFLEFGSRGDSSQDQFAVMTPGACTIGNFDTNTFVSKRLAYIAEHDHCIGGIIVEVSDTGVFHFRHLQADDNGDFIDLGHQYSNDGTVRMVKTNLVLGDIHANQLDQECLISFFKWTTDTLFIEDIFVHDIFDGTSISHHNSSPGDRANRFHNKDDSLLDELRLTAAVLDLIAKQTDKTVYVVKSNHDEWLTRYLRESRFVDDPVNHRFALKLADSIFEPDVDDLEHALDICRVGDVNLMEGKADNVVFLSRDSSMTISEVEMAAHGDLGTNGSIASLSQLEKIYRRCVVGHAHTAAIHRGVFRVGTFSKLRMGYNRGPSTWTQSAALVYPNGTVQIVNYISGSWNH